MGEKFQNLPAFINFLMSNCVCFYKTNGGNILQLFHFPIFQSKHTNDILQIKLGHLKRHADWSTIM